MNLLSLVSPWLDTNYQIQTKCYSSKFFQPFESKQGLNFLILLQEGRMRGQAFVTFPTVELAQRALVSDFGIDMMSCL
jgi:RNA recognition motif-containing protein